MKRQRLSRQSWIEAGLSELVTSGPNALAAEPLARQLGTTKGSFYWHFKDIKDFQAAVVKHWQSQALGDVLRALEDGGGPEHRLRRFGKGVLSNPQDPAIRAWARTDKQASKAMSQVDAERMKYFANLLRHLGISNDAFARSVVGALIGLPEITNKTQAGNSFDTMIDLILALK